MPSLPELRDAGAAVALLVAMLLAWRVGRTQRSGTAVLALVAFAWLTVDSDWEIAILLSLPPVHGHSLGLTLADLAGLAGLAAAAVQEMRRRQS